MTVIGIVDGTLVDLTRDAWRALGAETGDRLVVEHDDSILRAVVVSVDGYKRVQIFCHEHGECRVRWPFNPQQESQCHG